MYIECQEKICGRKGGDEYQEVKTSLKSSTSPVHVFGPSLHRCEDKYITSERQMCGAM